MEGCWNKETFYSLDESTNFGHQVVEIPIKSTLNSPISVGHRNSLEPTLLFNSRQNLSFKMSVGHMYRFPRKLV